MQSTETFMATNGISVRIVDSEAICFGEDDDVVYVRPNELEALRQYFLNENPTEDAGESLTKLIAEELANWRWDSVAPEMIAARYVAPQILSRFDVRRKPAENETPEPHESTMPDWPGVSDETHYLLSSEANKRHLLEGIAQLGALRSDGNMDNIRRSLGLVRPGYSRGRRFWNWLIDAEYTTVGPAPWIWAATGLAALGLIVAWVWIALT